MTWIRWRVSMLMLACLMLAGCLFRNVQLPPGHDLNHGLTCRDPLLYYLPGEPGKRTTWVRLPVDTIIGSTPCAHQTVAMARTLRECQGCHK